MGGRLKILTIAILTLGFSCNSGSNSKAKPPAAPPNLGDPPKFAKIDLGFSDTNTVEARRIIASLDTFYRTRVAGGFNGSVIVASKGKIFYERYFGYSQYDQGKMLNPETPSQLASTSKPFTAAAVALLKDRGLLNFDDPVEKFIAGWPYQGITLRMLLCHRSGLPEYLNFASGLRAKDAGFFMSNDELVTMMVAKKPAVYASPNTRFKYTNTNFALLSYIVGKVSGMPFPKFMKTMLFDPLGMKNSYIFDATQTHSTNYCKNYKSKWNVVQDMFLDGISGDKGAYSTPRDMLKWDQALYGGKLIKQRTLEEMYSPNSFENPGVKNYGLGWRMMQYPEQKIIFHNGYWHGNNTVFYRFINENFTIIVLGNKYNKQIYYHPLGIYNIIKGNQAQTQNWDTEE
jgi:CubicO group peptidase (beta-lactamase class C family)